MAESLHLTPNGVLRPYVPSHDEQTVRWLNSGELRATFGLRRTLSVPGHRQWMQEATDTVAWAVVDELDQHVGNVLLKISERHRSGYFQIYLGEPRVRGQGLGRAALTETLAYAFGVLQLHRVWLHTFPDNLAAAALYRRTGFVQEGIERDAILADGSFVSQLRWSLLAPEWHAAQRASK